MSFDWIGNVLQISEKIFDKNTPHFLMLPHDQIARLLDDCYNSMEVVVNYHSNKLPNLDEAYYGSAILKLR